MMKNGDLTRIINSDEIQRVLRPARLVHRTTSLERGTCTCVPHVYINNTLKAIKSCQNVNVLLIQYSIDG